MSRRQRQSSAFSLFAFQDIITSVTGIMILVTLVLALELIQRKIMEPEQRTKEVVQEMQTAVSEVTQLQETVAENQTRIAELKDAFSQGASRIGDVAGFDLARVREQTKELEELNKQVEGDITELQKKQKETASVLEEMRRAKESQAESPKTLDELRNEIKKKQEAMAKLKSSNRVVFNRSPGDQKNPWLVEISGSTLTVAEVGKSAKPQIFPNAAAFQSWAKSRDRNSEYFVILVKPDGIQTYADTRQILTDLAFDMGNDLLSATQTAIDLEIGAGTQ